MGIFRGYILGRTWKRIEEPCKQGSTVQLGPTSRGGWSSVGSESGRWSLVPKTGLASSRHSACSGAGLDTQCQDEYNETGLTHCDPSNCKWI